MQEIDTKRLRLRRFRPDDLGLFVALAGDPAVARMTSDIPSPLSKAEAQPWLQQEPGEVRFAIEIDGRLAGGVGYFHRGSAVGELGFWLARHLWGRGFATEAVKEVVRYGFDEGRLRGFTSSHFDDNPASERVLLKAGFQPAGRGSMWCAARKSMVFTVEYWLASPAHARRATAAGDRPRWRNLLGRVLRPQ